VLLKIALKMTTAIIVLISRTIKSSTFCRSCETCPELAEGAGIHFTQISSVQNLLCFTNNNIHPYWDNINDF
jgi:hypothetical protein